MNAPDESTGAFVAHCQEDAKDWTSIARGEVAGWPADAVCIAVGYGSVNFIGSVFLSPADARKAAVKLLDVADEIEGRTALLHFPPGPDGVFPAGHPDA